MNRLSYLPLLLCLIMLAPTQGHSKDLSISPYFEGRKAALSLTFDDGFRHQGKNHVAALDKAGFKGTFFIVVGQSKDKKPPAEWGNRMSWEHLRELHSQGHEIANHSWSHAKLTKHLPATMLDSEINHAYDVFKNKMGFAPYTFALPGGSKAKDVEHLVMKRHKLMRGAVMNYGGKRWNAKQVQASIERGVKSNEWFVAMIHAISKGYNAFASPKVFDDHLAYLTSRDNDLWVAPMASVSKYLHARKHAELKGRITGKTANFTLTVNADPAVYNHPLTVEIPAGKATRATAKAGKTVLKTTIKQGKILVNVQPSKKPTSVRVTFK